MKSAEQKRALNASVEAAHAVGKLMRQNLRLTKKVDVQSQHDIKLELDVRSQKLIEKRLATEFPEISVLGEEGSTGEQESEYRWIIDPIDGTVNFSYTIPHACVSIALQQKKGNGYQTTVGVVYDPFTDELWTAVRGQPAFLNKKKIEASKRKSLDQCIVSVGFSKSKETMDKMLPYFNSLLPRIRKVRMMGSAAMALTYVASGRFDAYIETGVQLWDIAAGGLIVECAGGEFWNQELATQHKFKVLANNGLIRKQLEKIGPL
ncbi:MAG: Inositol-monophosphatase [Verrucomicrobiales bacterium]|nr:Inositol-monophosphatase [Verrucomicrobiales bacterium]